MSFEVFTEPWALAWADALRESEAYRRAAERWERSILIEMEADPGRGIAGERAVFLDLWHGECRDGRVADGEDRDGADYVIRGSAEAWRRILVRNELMPGMQQAVAHLKSDESRHLAYGVYLLSRLVAEHGDLVAVA